MQVREADERDSSWERNDPRYRLYTFEGPGNAVMTFDFLDALWHEVEWSAEILAGADKLWSVALVLDDSNAGRGLVWLVGGDYNSPPTSPRHWRMRAEMQDRYLLNRSRKKLPLTLPDGRQVVRFFPDWGRDWPLWESFSDGDTLTADDLHLSERLATRVKEWNDAWQSRQEADPLPPGWIQRGHEVHAEVQRELVHVAEVRPDFCMR